MISWLLLRVGGGGVCSNVFGGNSTNTPKLSESYFRICFIGTIACLETLDPRFNTDGGKPTTVTDTLSSKELLTPAKVVADVRSKIIRVGWQHYFSS